MTELDARQSAAVDAGPVDLLIAAGAGSGKTRVLTERFVAAVLGVEPYERIDPAAVVAVTFTERAAGELASRVRAGLMRASAVAQARSLDEAWISTIHGMCARIVREHALEAGVDPRFTVATEVEAGVLAHEALLAAVGPALESDDVAGLIDAYGFDTVAAGVTSVHSAARSLGRSAADVRTVEEAAADSRLRGLVAEVERIAEALQGLRRTPLVERTIEAVLRFAEALRKVTCGGLSSEWGAALSAAVADCSVKGGAVEGLTDLVTATKEVLASIRALAAQAEVQVFERALLTLTCAFEREFAALKATHGVLDFEDLQLVAAGLLDRPGIAEEYRSRFRMIMVDEYQDTDPLQSAVIEAVSSANLSTVGDEQQSIYGFRNADVEVFRERARRVGRSVALDTNYRSHPTLLNAINGLFASSSLFGDAAAPLHPGLACGDEPRAGCAIAFVLPSDDCTSKMAEASAVADEVERLMSSGVAAGDVAVLLRAMRGWAELVEERLQAAGIPTFVASGGTYFDRPEVNQAVALLRVIDNVLDDAALLTVLTSRLVSLSADALFRLRQQAGRSSLWTAAVAPQGLDDADVALLERAVSAIEAGRSRRVASSLYDVLLGTCLALDFDLALMADGTSGLRAWANVVKLARLAAEFERAGGPDIGGFLEYLRERRVHGAYEQQAPVTGEHAKAVRIMSIHAAKGLEFPHVVVGGLGPRTTPSQCVATARIGGELLLGMHLRRVGEPKSEPTEGSILVREVRQQAERAEAIRVLYVAATRAETSLTLVVPGDPGKDADTSLAGAIRTAVGMQEVGGLAETDVTLGSGTVGVRLVTPSAPPPSPVAEAGECVTPGRIPEGLAGLCGPPGAGMPATVSYSGLALYERCPFRAYVSSIVGLRSAAPVRGESPTDPLAFGSAVHAALAHMATAGSLPRSRLLALAEQAGLDDGGLERLAEAVGKYATSDVASRIGRSPSVEPEVPLCVPIGDTVLVGSIDLLARDGGHAQVVDYKTGSAPLAASEAKDRYRLQGACYALAVLRGGAEQATVSFVEIERGCRETLYEYAREHISAIEAELLGVLDRMRAGEWDPCDRYDPRTCDGCPALGGLCPVTPPRAA